MNRYDKLFVVTSFFIQIVLLIYFGVRKWQFDLALTWGWLVYALAIPALIVSMILLKNRKPWFLWIAGFFFTMWAILGFVVDIVYPVAWREPMYLPVFIPYVLLYLASLMFYWWPLARIKRPLWYIYAALFVVSTYLNISSH